MLRVLAIAVLAMVWVAPSQAQTGADCLAMASAEPRVIPAALTETQVQLTYAGHSTFVIETAGGIRIATDYAGWAGGITPDVVTMNRAHSTHFTDFPDAAIKHVLRGWGEDGTPASHDVQIGDARIRNITTDIRAGGGGLRMKDGNSIFVFEIAGLCIGHLGHLHHELTPAHIGWIGRLDIVLVPVDGGYTMAQVNMMQVLKDLKARVVIPMHYFGPATLARFIANAQADYDVEYAKDAVVVLSLDALPAKPKLLVLPGN